MSAKPDMNPTKLSEEFVYKIRSAVHGYHIYQKFWERLIREELTTQLETDSEMYKHSVAVICHGRVVGHLPAERAKFFFS